jgi:hypothetical protein
MPTQHLLTADAEERFNRHHRADLMTIPVGQAVGQIHARRSVAEIMQGLTRDFGDAVAELAQLA